MKDYWETDLKIQTAKTAQTSIPNKFIDELMVTANGEYVKIFLYLLRHAGENVTEDSIADALELTGADVKRALAFLDKNGAFEGILEEAGEDRQVDIASLQDNDEFKALLFELQNYLGKTFTIHDAEIIGYMYDNMQMPAELIEYLFEVCKQKGKTSLRYIEKVAQNWHKAGITSVEEAKQDAAVFNDEIEAVKKSFGIKSRDLAEKEMEYILRWIREYRLPTALVTEACSRTVLSTGKAAFSYADSILRGWKEKNITDVEQLRELDSEHKSAVEKEYKESKTKTSSKTKNNSFHNFTQRDESLDKDVLDKFNDLFK